MAALKARIAELEETVHSLIAGEAAQRNANTRQMFENRELKKRVEALQRAAESSNGEEGDFPLQRLQNIVKEADYQRRLDLKVRQLLRLLCPGTCYSVVQVRKQHAGPLATSKHLAGPSSR